MSDVTLQLPLPAALDAERLLLGIILLDNSVLEQLSGWEPARFFLLSHQQIFAAMLSSRARYQAITPITLQDELHRQGQLSQIGGPAYIASLFDGVPRFSNISSYAQLVTEKAALRRLARLGQDLITRAFADDGTEIEEIIRQLECELLQLRTGSSGQMRSEWFGSVLMRAWDEQSRPRTTATGFTQLDSLLLAGGLAPGDECVIAARTSRGKSTLALQIAGNICDRFDLESARAGDRAALDDRPVVLFFALEQSKEALARRAVGIRAQVSAESMARWEFQADELARIRGELGRAGYWRLATYDIRRTTLSDIAAECRKVRYATGRLDAVIVDHLGLIKLDRRFGQQYQEVGYLTSELKTMAGEHGIEAPFIVPVQIKRAGLGKDKFDLEDLRLSGDIEQDADKVVIVQLPGEEMPEGYNHEVTLAKQREGQVGSVEFYFDRTYGGFAERPGTLVRGFRTSTARRQSRRRPAAPPYVDPALTGDEEGDGDRF